MINGVGLCSRRHYQACCYQHAHETNNTNFLYIHFFIFHLLNFSTSFDQTFSKSLMRSVFRKRFSKGLKRPLLKKRVFLLAPVFFSFCAPEWFQTTFFFLQGHFFPIPVLLTFIQFFFYHPIHYHFFHLHAFQPIIPEKRKKRVFCNFVV